MVDIIFFLRVMINITRMAAKSRAISPHTTPKTIAKRELDGLTCSEPVSVVLRGVGPVVVARSSTLGVVVEFVVVSVAGIVLAIVV